MGLLTRSADTPILTSLNLVALLALVSITNLTGATQRFGSPAGSAHSRGRRRTAEAGGEAEEPDDDDDDDQQHLIVSWWRRLSSLGSWASRNLLANRTLIKLLLVLVYAQMLIQQMDNREHLQDQTKLLESLGARAEEAPVAACCGRHAHTESAATDAQPAPLLGWFECMWSSARACSGLGPRPAEGRGGLADYLRSTVGATYRLSGFFNLVNTLWLARWRSPIIQRLGQSMLVQVCYASSLLFARAATDRDLGI